MAEEGTRTILRYESDCAAVYRGTANPFAGAVSPGTDRHPVPSALEMMRVFPKGHADFGKTVLFEVPQREVLLGKQTLAFVLPALTVYSASSGNYVPFRWPNVPACAIVESVQLVIDGFVADTVTGEHLNIKIETMPATESKYETARANAGEDNTPGRYLTTMFDAAAIAADATKRTKGTKMLFLDLDFWFGDSPATEFPNVGKIVFRVKFRALTSVVKVSGGINSDTIISTSVAAQAAPALSGVELLLSTRWVSPSVAAAILRPRRCPMRQHFTTTLGTVVDGGAVTARTEYIPRPITDVVWVVQDESSLRNMGNAYFTYTDSSGSALMLTASLYSGATRIQETMDAEFFNLCTPMVYGRRIPSTGIYMAKISDVPVDISSSGSFGRAFGIRMTTQTGAGDVSVRVFSDMYAYFSIEDSKDGPVISFDAAL